jgi:hypothetical protein
MIWAHVHLALKRQARQSPPSGLSPSYIAAIIVTTGPQYIPRLRRLFGVKE